MLLRVLTIQEWIDTGRGGGRADSADRGDCWGKEVKWVIGRMPVSGIELEETSVV
jgi:hypothetical protein